MRLKDKAAIVTGAGSGIGRGIASMFAQEGAKILVADVSEQGGRETAAMIEAAGGQALFSKVDVSSQEDTRRMAAEAAEAWGAIDILVNNAAILRIGSVLEQSVEDWDLTMNVNLKGVYLASRAALPYMLDKGGAILNIASVGGLVGAKELAAYATAKAGVINLTRQMASDYGPRKVRVNSICPGTIITPMHDAFYTPETKDATLEEWGRTRPLRTNGTPEDIAYAAVFLCSNVEARFVTGANLVIDGGIIAAGG